jgi:hypothetical protein
MGEQMYSTRLRPLAVAVLLGFGCKGDNAAPESLTAPAPEVTSADSAVRLDSAARTTAALTHVGIPYGPSGLWEMHKLRGPTQPFTASHNFILADTLVLQINNARSRSHRLVVALTGGPSTRYTTNGQFDMSKWKATMNTYNKPGLKTAMAAAVLDGTVIGYSLIDEPETKQWGSVLTKAMIDQMVVYAKSIFPTLPVGLAHGPPGYTWRSFERYTKLDYVLYQFNHFFTSGNVVAWRDAVLAQARRDGVTPALSLNVLNGGRQDRDDGVYDCAGPGQGGFGTRFPNCSMTPDQIRTWGKALTPYACFMMVWRYNAAYMSNTANQAAFKELATLAASKPRRSCRRP